jgi:hypothetical protein
MPFVRDHDSLSVKALVALIRESPIVAAEPNKLAVCFLVGFEDVDIAVLQWIAGERGRIGTNAVM